MFYLLLFGTFLPLFFTYNFAQIVELRNAHDAKTLTNLQLNNVAELSNITHLNEALDNICVPRVVGTPAHDKVHTYIVSQLKDLGWSVEVDSFDEKTPTFGVLRFRNIIATLNQNAERYLALACHYDSKYYKDFNFEGATDSAVPCAMMLNLASVMKKELEPIRDDVDLKLIFFDGEEAFRRWEPKDSIYGARHLAAKFEQQTRITARGLRVTRLDQLDMLVLLDLLGAPNPRFYSYFGDTVKWYAKLMEAELRLRKRGLLERSSRYFQQQQIQAYIEDDHVPFLQRGVPILHLIPTPFPDVWHKVSDNRQAVDIAATENLNKILRIFVAEYLHLDIDEGNLDEDEDTLRVEL